MKSYGYPSEWNIPAENSPGLNQPGKRDPQVSPAEFAKHIRGKDTTRVGPQFATRVQGSTPEERIAQRNKDWLRSVELEQRARRSNR